MDVSAPESKMIEEENERPLATLARLPKSIQGADKLVYLEQTVQTETREQNL
jgi:hypothetical protein